MMDRYQLRTLLVTLPGLVFSKRQRVLLGEMRSFDKDLARKMGQPLPLAMEEMTPEQVPDDPDPGAQRLIRRLADTAILFNGESGLGLCLRRSTLRYYFLRRFGLPLTINFGAKMIAGKPDRAVAGHAWLTLQQEPYHESGENWRGFTIMYSHPTERA